MKISAALLPIAFLILACQPGVEDDPYRFTLQDEHQCITSASHKTKAAYCADLLNDKKWGSCAKEERLAKYNAECAQRIADTSQLLVEDNSLQLPTHSAYIDQSEYDQLNKQILLKVSYYSTSCAQDEFSLEVQDCEYKNKRMVAVANLVRHEMAPDEHHCSWFIGNRQVTLDVSNLTCSPHDLIIFGENDSQAVFSIR